MASILSRINPKIELPVPTAVVHNPTMFHENRSKAFQIHVIMLTCRHCKNVPP